MQITPEQTTRFHQIDTDNSGELDCNEIQRAFTSINFPPRSARLLLHAITDNPRIDIQTFPVFDYYINQFYAAFSQQRSVALKSEQVYLAVQQLHFPLPLQQGHVDALCKKYGEDGRVDYGQFLAVCSYIMLCLKLLGKFGQGRGQIMVDVNGLLNLGLWFV